MAIETECEDRETESRAAATRQIMPSLFPYRERLQPTAAVVADVFAGAICTCAIVIENDCVPYYSDE